MTKPTPINEEIELDPKRYIVSETDEKGKITFCNDYFVEVCGYSSFLKRIFHLFSIDRT